MASRTIVRDWAEGDDPGMACFKVTGGDGVALSGTTAAPGDFAPGGVAPAQWSCAVYDLTANPSVVIKTFTQATSPNTMEFFTPLRIDGWWTSDDVGYNARHYVRADAFTTPALVGGHTYRFVYMFATDAYDKVAGNFGQLTYVREGTCIARGGA